jgi:hypothetical protein
MQGGIAWKIILGKVVGEMDAAFCASHCEIIKKSTEIRLERKMRVSLFWIFSRAWKMVGG